jgi:hypothetical protein
MHSTSTCYRQCVLPSSLLRNGQGDFTILRTKRININGEQPQGELTTVHGQCLDFQDREKISLFNLLLSFGNLDIFRGHFYFIHTTSLSPFKPEDFEIFTVIHSIG